MQLFNFANLFLTVGLAAVSVTATPIDDALIAEAVQSGELVEVEKVTELDKRQCAACGVYLCAGKDFTGQCYWGCYPPRKLVEVDDYWRTHIASVGPDKGCYCTIGTPDKSSCQGFESPGGNVGKNNCYGNVGNFYCVPQ